MDTSKIKKKTLLKLPCVSAYMLMRERKINIFCSFLQAMHPAQHTELYSTVSIDLEIIMVRLSKPAKVFELRSVSMDYTEMAINYIPQLPYLFKHCSD